MSDASTAGGSEELRFEHAEYATPGTSATCKLCGQAMGNVYYEMNSQAVCQHCHERIQTSLTSGSAFGRFVRATFYGSLAGLFGAAIYYGVRELTQIEFGLISILVGLMIGKAVKTGSDARGGWFYQALAMFLTYTAIVMTYIPPIMKAVGEQDRQVAAQAQPGQQPAQPGQQPAQPGAAAAPGDAVNPEPPSLVGFLFALVFLIGFAYAIPVLVGFQSPMGLVIIGIGLYEAWVINKRVPLSISGPYRIAADTGGPGGRIHAEPAG
ncbi:MAG TPA: hypothetical protein VHC22_30050 [Pirellulales bacterium]|nr:hypothetical protein [Pirellulales bacterium]